MSLFKLRFTFFKSLFVVSTLLLPQLLAAHNNPEFKNELIKSMTVLAEKSDAFTLTLAKDAVRVVWRIKSNDKDHIVFSIKSGDEIIQTDISDGTETVPNLLENKELTIVDVTGTKEASFELDILVRSIVSKTDNKGAATKLKVGRDVYRKANCVGCHKWHGDGGSSKGGTALSLRTTKLDTAGIEYLVRCGRPASGMPYHGRNAYKGDDKSCYNKTGAELGENIPPRAKKLLSQRQMDAVVEYVVNVIQGSGEQTLEQCVAYWGEKSRQCDSFRQ